MRNKTLTWLHLSDIHLQPKTEWRDSSSRESMLGYLKSIYEKDESLLPDLIFCTGDIAFGETHSAPLSDQYTQARKFFDSLLETCGRGNKPFPKDRLFMVPGNHDVNRERVNSDAQSMLITLAKEPHQHADAMNQRFNDRSSEFNDSIRRLEEYGNFVKDYLPHQHDDDGRHCYAKVVSVNGFNVGVVGFNSAWTCAGGEDDRNIWLAGAWQFNTAFTQIKNADVKIGLIHHPVDWLNAADRDIATPRIASDFDFWLHGHCHTAWVTPIQTHIVVAAGAVGAEKSDEFGINITCIKSASQKGVVHLHNTRVGSNGWTIAPVHTHAPVGQWEFDLPTRLKTYLSVVVTEHTRVEDPTSIPTVSDAKQDFVDRYLSKRLDDALQAFSSQPRVWVYPTISCQAEDSHDAKTAEKLDLFDLIKNPKSSIIKAAPQFGLTCLANFLILEAWRKRENSVWVYLDSKELKANAASISKAVNDELAISGCDENDIKCIVIDSWNVQDKDALKLLQKISELFSDVRLICLQQVNDSFMSELKTETLPREFEFFYLWSLSRVQIRKIVTDYNDVRMVGDEDSITSKLVSDLEVLNLHRTALNCLTLLKVTEVDFDESPVNRSEMIKRVLFLLFNIDEIPTYKSRPDLKDCEYVLGFFCEYLIREDVYQFSRDRFLLEINRCCRDRLIDLETNVVFDVLYNNSIIVKRGSVFCFKFSYWIYYFAAQRMLHSEDFATYIFEDMRYARAPEIIEFYTGVDRRREDALRILTRDIEACCKHVKSTCGLPDGLNPYRFAQWISTPEAEAKMQKEILDGVMESNLPASLKDQYADRNYDRARPYNQSVSDILTGHSFNCMIQTMKSGARALRNSDYVSPEIKRQLLREILNCWEQASKVMFIVLPILASDGYAAYDGINFVLSGDFGSTPQERALRLLGEIPYNVVKHCENDLFSKKMGPLLFDQFNDKTVCDLVKHELVLLLIRQRPRDWSKHVQSYIVSNSKNSFYLLDVYLKLRSQYRYGFATHQTLKEIEYLIKMTMTKHVTGDRAPGKVTIEKAIKKMVFKEDLIPPREVL